MANNITGNPIYIDSVGVLFTGRWKCDAGIWNNAAAGDTFELVDNVGRVIFFATFPTDLQPVPIPKIGWINGLTCTVATGNATIYVALK